MKPVLAILAAAFLGGCAASIPPPEYVPPLLLCDARCQKPCDTSPPPDWAPPDPDHPSAWDWIRPQVVQPLHQRVLVCEEHRRACTACLDEAARQGIVVSQEP